MTIRHDLHVRQGETWSFTYTHLDSAGAAVDLTGYSARMSVKAGYESLAEAFLSSGSDADGGTIALGGAAGTVALSMTAAQTAVLADDLSLHVLREKPRRVGPYVAFLYDLELVDGSGNVTRALEGEFIVYREVTG